MVVYLCAEVLHRLELWHVANELVAGPGVCSSDKLIQQLHVNNTATYASCGSCKRPLNAPDSSGGSYAFCSKCRTVASSCAIW
jgi:hypothetical protein